MTNPPPAPERTTGATLRALREGVGMSLDDMAERAAVSKTSLSMYESGQRHVGNGQLARILDAIADAMVEQTVGAR